MADTKSQCNGEGVGRHDSTTTTRRRRRHGNRDRAGKRDTREKTTHKYQASESVHLSEDGASQTLEILNQLLKLAYKWGNESRIYGNLGRALIWVSDERNAQVAFQQEIDHRDGVWVYVDISCNGCNHPLTCSTKQFVCKHCQDIDVCGECFKSKKDIKLPSCSNHNFLEITPEAVSGSYEEPPDPAAERDLWLQNLMKEYSKPGLDSRETFGA